MRVEHHSRYPLFVNSDRSENYIMKFAEALYLIAKDVYDKKSHFDTSKMKLQHQLSISLLAIIVVSSSIWCNRTSGHCHFNGKFLGYVCTIALLFETQSRNCYTNCCTASKSIDLHHVCKRQTEFSRDCIVAVIPSPGETYISQSVGVPLRAYKDKNGTPKQCMRKFDFWVHFVLWAVPETNLSFTSTEKTSNCWIFTRVKLMQTKGNLYPVKAIFLILIHFAC